MPLSYPSGTIKEHMATREGVAIFDVSHLGTVRVEGPNSLAQLQQAFTNDLNKISKGRAQYTHLLDPSDGSVLDDIIIWWTDPEGFDVMPNASNTSRVLNYIQGTDVTSTRSIIAVQGPIYKEVLSEVIPEGIDVAHLEVRTLTWQNAKIKIAGTGYTGENGIEIFAPNQIASKIWGDLVKAGATPAGLGARDTLRLEAGLPLHGHELGKGISPLESGLQWVVAFSKPEFLGKQALLNQLEKGLKKTLVGIQGQSRKPLRAGQTILLDNKEIGTISSGGYSPILKLGIGLGFVETGYEIDQSVNIDSNGAILKAKLVKPPFVRKSYSNL